MNPTPPPPSLGSTSHDMAWLQGMLLAGLDLLDEGVSLFDENLTLLAWNRLFIDLLGFPEEMVKVGTPFEDFIRYNAQHGEYGEGDIASMVAGRMAVARSRQTSRAERTQANGRVLLVRGEPLPNGGLITLYADITRQHSEERALRQQYVMLEQSVGRRAAELEAANAQLIDANAVNTQITAALKRSEERLRLITDTIPALIAYFDKKEIYRYTNKGYSDWFGRKTEHIEDRHIEAALGSKFYAAVHSYVLTALGGQQVTYEYSMDKEDGSVVFARSTLVPELSPDGEVQGCFVLSFDITEQKRTQAALVQAQKMEAVGQLSGGIAHDFNNMLTVVIGNLAELRVRLEENPALIEFLDPAMQAAERGVELIKRLLTFSRQQPLEPAPVQIGGLVLGMMKLLRRSLPENIAIDTQLPDDPLYAMADPHQLESAMLNLTLNARDAMPDGGHLRIDARAVEINAKDALSLELDKGEYVQINMADTGLGMDESVQLRVFEPFFTTKKFGSGSGLGLSMVYGFVKQSGGGVKVTSAPGHGTIVSLFLPRADEASLPTGRLNFRGLAGGREKLLVLLVEDDPDVRRVVRLQLTGLGYPVLEAASGDEAADMLNAVPEIGLLLSDVVMPGSLNGRALAKFARTSRPQVRVVLMSGYTDEAHNAPTLDELPPVPLLKKPFTQAQLSALLDEVTLCHSQAT